MVRAAGANARAWRHQGQQARFPAGVSDSAPRIGWHSRRSAPSAPYLDLCLDGGQRTSFVIDNERSCILAPRREGAWSNPVEDAVAQRGDERVPQGRSPQRDLIAGKHRPLVVVVRLSFVQLSARGRSRRGYHGATTSAADSPLGIDDQVTG